MIYQFLTLAGEFTTMYKFIHTVLSDANNMRRTQSYHKLLLAFNLVYGLFCYVAIDYRMHSAGLPEELSLFPSHGNVRFIDNVAVNNQYDLDFILSHYRIGDIVRVETSDRQIDSVQLVHAYRLSEVIMTAITGLLMFSLSLFVYLSRPQEPASVVFNIVSVTTCAALLGMREIYSFSSANGLWWVGDASAALFFLANVFFAISFLHFTFVFPTVQDGGVHRPLTVLYLVGVVLAAVESIVYLRVTTSGSMELLHQSARVSMVHNFIILLLLVYGIVRFIVSYKRTVDDSERKRLRWILLGLSVGPFPFIFFWVLPQAFGGSPLISESAFTLLLLLIPVTFTISIVRHRVLDVDILINRGVVYALVVGVILGISAAVVAFLVTYLGLPSVYASTAVGVLVALFIERLRLTIQHFVDKKFFRVQYNYRETQRTFVDEIKKCLDIRQLTALIVQTANELIPVERIGFFVLDRRSYRLHLIAQKNFEVLHRHGVHFDIEHLKTDLGKPVAVTSSIEPGISHEPAEEKVFLRWGMTIVFPVMIEQCEILGFLVLGEKKSRAKFSVEDVDLLSTVAVQAALTMQRIELQRRFILEHEETQRLEELNKLKSYFVSSVSHDLKTPLTSIRMFAELLHSGKKASQKKTQEYLEIIEGESERLTRLINNVLDFAKVERGVKEYHFAEIELNSVVGNVLKSMEYQLKMERCSVKAKLVKKDFPIRADADAVAEALMNLISNSMKYSPKVKQIAVRTFQQNGFVGVKIQDKGIGIAKDDLQHIFEPFVRAKDDKARQVGGTGLGLSLVKHIMDAHGGKIEVQSIPRKGSSFTLLFPIGSDS